MKNFREKVSKTSDKVWNKVMYGEPLCCDYFSLALQTLPYFILTVVITIFATRAITIEQYKDSQRNALEYFYSEYMDDCNEVNNGGCHWEFTYQNNVITDISVKDDEGYYFAHYLDK